MRAPLRTLCRPGTALHRPTPGRLGLLGLLLIAAAAVQAQAPLTVQEPLIVQAQRNAAGQGYLLIQASAQLPAGAVDEIRLTLPDGTATAGHLPAQWRTLQDGPRLRLAGPPLDAAQLHVRLDLAPGPLPEAVEVALLGEARGLLSQTVPVAPLGPLRVVRALADHLRLPASAAPGDLLHLRVLDLGTTPASGVWTVAGRPASALADDPSRLTVHLPESLGREGVVPVVYTDPYGLVSVEVSDAGLRVDATATGTDARLTGCTPRGFRGRVICVCGVFPTAEARASLTLGGRPLGPPEAASSRVVHVRIPDDMAPGPHTLAGRGVDGTQTLVVLTAQGEVDLERIQTGGSTPLRVVVAGSDDPLRVRLTNLTPATIDLEGGVEQVVTTSGGAPNTLVRTVTGLSPGPFNVHYELDEDPCPCTQDGGPLVAEGGPPVSPPIRPEDPGGDPAPPVDLPTPFPTPEHPEPDTLVTPPDRPPTIYGEEDEEEADSLCCGFRGPLLVYPRTTDPMAVPEVPTAPHDPATAAMQVLLPMGAYVHVERDLLVDAVGFPFEWTRHYASNLLTEEGGIIGHGWDFSLNKRIVPVPDLELGGGLVAERPETSQARLYYYNGYGRAERYVEDHAQWRMVLNFGQPLPFRAFVTTYASPPGAFHEIQRYVLETPEDHPFGDHPAVDLAHGESIFYVLREKNGLRYVFNCRGQVLYVLSRHDYTSLAGSATTAHAAPDSVRMALFYQGPINPLTQSPMLSSVVDASGHAYRIETDQVFIGQHQLDTNIENRPRTGTLPIPRLSAIRGGGVEVEYRYADDNQRPELDAVVLRYDDTEAETRYAYDAEHRLLTVVAPNEVARGAFDAPFIENVYADHNGAVILQRAAGETRYRLVYSAFDGILVTDGDGHRERIELEQKGPYYVVKQRTLTSARAQDGGPWTTQYAHNDYTQITALILPRGNTISYAYDDSNEPVTLGPLRNWLDRDWTYANNLSQGNLLGVTRSVGTVETVEGPTALSIGSTYEPLFNQPDVVTDARGVTTDYAYAYEHKGDFGNPVEVGLPPLTQPDGSRLPQAPLRYTYTDQGLLHEASRSSTLTTTYTYDPLRHYLVRVDYPGGAFRSYENDDYGYVLTESGSFGTVAYGRDGRGLITRQVLDPDGFADETTYTYDPNGNLTETRVVVQDRFRSRSPVRFEDSAGEGPRAARPYDQIATTRYDRLNRPVREERRGGDAVFARTTTYDVMGRVSTSTEPSPTGRDSVTTTYTYDARGLPVQHTREHGRGQLGREERVSWSRYDENGNEVESGDGPREEPAATSGPPSCDRPSTQRRSRTFAYDGFDRVTMVTDALGSRTIRVLDENGNLVAQEILGATGRDHPGSPQASLSRQRFAYNERDAIIAATDYVLDPDGTTLRTEHYYNAFGAVRQVVQPNGSATTYQYDEAGRLVQTDDPLGTYTITTYDEAGRKATVTEGEVEHVYYRDTHQWEAEERTTLWRFTYDSAGHLTHQRGPLGDAHYFYDSLGRLRGTYDQVTGLTETQYDGLGRPERVMQGRTEQVLTYLPTGHLAERRLPHDHRRWRYDLDGLEIEQTDLLNGGTATIQRDNLGNPVCTTDPNGTTVTRTFNAIGLPTDHRVAYRNRGLDLEGERVSTLSGASTERFRFDGLGRIVSAEIDEGVIQTTFRYDGIGRVTHEAQIFQDHHQTIDRTYSPEGTWSETRYPELTGSPVVRHHYNDLGQVVRVDLDGEMLASYLYNGTDRIAGRSLRNGALTAYTYDEARRLSDIWITTDAEAGRSHYEASASYEGLRVVAVAERFQGDDDRSTRRSTTTYTYDTEGRATRVVTTTRSGTTEAPLVSVSGTLTAFDGARPATLAEYLYDEVDGTRHLRFARTLDFEYDGARVEAVTNRLRLTFEEGERYALESAGMVAGVVGAGTPAEHRQVFLYDANGNRIADARNVYAYDHANRLTSIHERPSGRVYAERVDFLYDALGRRIAQRPYREPATRPGLLQWATWARYATLFLYDGDMVVGEADFWRPDADRALALIARYIPGPRPGERIRMDRRVDEDPQGDFVPYYFHTGIQSQLAFLSDGLGRPHATGYDPTLASGDLVRPPDDLHVILGTRTRSPYLGASLRVDTFAGLKYQEQSGLPLFDFRSDYTLAEGLDLGHYQGSITAFQNRGALLLGAATVTAFFPVASLVGGLLNVGIGAGVSWYREQPYSSDDTALHYAEGALSSAGGGTLAPTGSGLARMVVGNVTADYAVGVTTDVLGRGRALGDAMAENAKAAALGGGINLATGKLMAVASRTALAQRLGRAIAQRLHVKAPAHISADAPVRPPAHTRSTPPGQRAATQVADAPRAQSDARRLQDELVYLLANGDDLSRYALRLLREGKIHIESRNLGPGTWGEWQGGNRIFLNPTTIKQHPRFALFAAATIVHETSHALGGGEIAAHIAEARFLWGWQRRGATAFPASAQSRSFMYHLENKHRSLETAYDRLVREQDVLPLISVLAHSGYGVHTGKPFYFTNKYVMGMAPHLKGLNRGLRGWARALNLDPQTAAFLEQTARLNGALYY